jgi:hypothetical protein
VELSSKWRFDWQWNHPALPEDLAFDLLIWSEAEQGLNRDSWQGVITPSQNTWADVEVGEIAPVQEHGEGTYYWTVIVVRKEPYKRVGQWGELRPFVYKPSSPLPLDPCDNFNCNKCCPTASNPLCNQCCPGFVCP